MANAGKKNQYCCVILAKEIFGTKQRSYVVLIVMVSCISFLLFAESRIEGIGRAIWMRTESQQNNGRAIIILTAGRSGSTLLGEIFDSSPTVFYWDEPFQASKGYNISIDGKIAIVKSILNCEFNEDMLSYVQEYSRKAYGRIIHSSTLTSIMKNQTSQRDLNATKLTQRDFRNFISRCPSGECFLRLIKKHCHGRPDKKVHPVVKVLQQRIARSSAANTNQEHFFDKLFDDSVAPVGIVFLVRNPIAILSSMQSANWSNEHNFGKTAKFTCKITTKYMQQLKLLSKKRAQVKHMVVTYEDLIRKPKDTVKRLFDFAGIPLTIHVERFLYKKLASEATDKDYYSLNRVWGHQIEKWKRTRNTELEDAVNRYCDDYMKEFGYNLHSTN